MTETMNFEQYMDLSSRTAKVMTKEEHHYEALNLMSQLTDSRAGGDLIRDLLGLYSRNPTNSNGARPMTPWEQELLFSALGAAGESGEIADYFKKVFAHGHPMDVEKLKNEIGDVLWYLSNLSRLAGFSLGDAAVANIEKLKRRYPDGFSTERSINRKE